MWRAVLNAWQRWRTRTGEATTPSSSEPLPGEPLSHRDIEQELQGGSNNLQVGTANDVISTTQHINHITIIQMAGGQTQDAPQPARQAEATPDQKEALNLYRQLSKPAQGRVEKFMHEQWRTTYIKALAETDLKRLKGYLKATLRNEQRARREPCRERA